jgi:thiamine pyrophosphate-dependent acetolactate synthase large subunit-like protein
MKESLACPELLIDKSEPALHSSGRFSRLAFLTSLGAKCAAPDRQSFALLIMREIYYYIAEVETMLHHDLKVVVVVNNNSSLN